MIALPESFHASDFMAEAEAFHDTPFAKTLTEATGYFMQRAGLDCVELNGVPVEIPNFGRQQLAELFAWLGFTKGAEIGVKRGEFSEVLCQANPTAEVIYSVDPFKSYPGYRNGRQDGMDVYFAEATARLAPYRNNVILRKFSVEAAREFPDNSLDWVFIDAAHDYVNVVNDVHEWSRVVRSGGCVSGHDWIHRGPKRDGTLNTSHKVIEAVTGYAKSYHINPVFVLGRKEFIPGEVRDLERSWLFVKK